MHVLGTLVAKPQHFLLVTQSFFRQNHFKNWHLALRGHKWEKSTRYSPMIMKRNMVMVRWCVQKHFQKITIQIKVLLNLFKIIDCKERSQLYLFSPEKWPFCEQPENHLAERINVDQFVLYMQVRMIST